MRIRKNAKNLSSLLMFSHASGAEPLQSHVCQLNQSPWDVIPFSQETYSSSSLPHQFEFEGEDSFNGTGSLGDSIGAVESNIISPSPADWEEDELEEKKVDKMLMDDNSETEEDEEEDEEEEEEEMKIECRKKSGAKGWHCRNENNLTSMKSYSDNLTKTTKKTAGTGRRGRPAKAARKGTTTTSNSASNPYEFYYYSGFGPRWGKRRGGETRNKIAEIDEIGMSMQNTTSFSVDHFEDLDFLDDDEDSEENGEIVKKKRMRKPVKARSLKSLM